MIKLILILVIAMIFISVSSSFALVSQKETLEGIIESLETHPELWFDTAHNLIYCSDQKILKEVSKQLFPESDQRAEITISYSIWKGYARAYVKLEKPFEYRFKDDLLKQILIQIKVYKLNKLHKDIGHLIKKPKQVPNIKEQPVVKKEQTNEVKAFRKL